MLEIHVPGSKSITHRALLLAAQADGTSMLRGALDCADTRATMEALRTMGATIRRGGDGTVVVEGRPIHRPSGILDCANSGTTMRLMLGTAARFPWKTTCTGDASLARRPHGPLVRALRHGQAHVTQGDGTITVQGPLRPARFEVSGQSSQYASSLLLSLPMLDGDSGLVSDPSGSHGYLDLTRHVAQAFGIRLGQGPGGTWTIPGGQAPTCCALQVEGDWSAAAFPLVAGALLQRRVRIPGLGPGSHQPDAALASILPLFGHRLQGDTLEPGSTTTPGTIDIGGYPDLFPALCVLAAQAPAATRFRGAPGLRHKECDRIDAMATALRRLGHTVEEHPDGLTVKPGRRPTGTLSCPGDHRIHMALYVAAIAQQVPFSCPWPACVEVSFPTFHQAIAP